MNKLSNTTCLGSTDTEKLKRPLPNNFEAFLPWAVRHLQLNVEVVIARVTQEEYVSIRGSEMSKSKVKGKAKTEQRAKDESNDESISWQQIRLEQEDAVSIQVTYDNADNLIKMKFNKNWSIPRGVLKIIALIIKFYPNLTALVINKGLNMAIVHEIQNLLAVSNITDVCLDNTFVREANYHILLQTPGNLKYLSLARCCINDMAIKNIAINLHYGTKASKTLCILNLASNRITDLGARHLADALKTNRKLCYLNLSDNAITDYGAICILNTLAEFMLTNEELLAYKTRHMAYLRERNALITKIAKELKLSDTGGKLTRRKPMKPLIMPLRKKSKAMEREHSIKGLSEGKSFINTDFIWQEKANQMAEAAMGPFIDPYSTSNTFVKDNFLYCVGNNTLCYLNLAYNNLSYFALNKILDVVNAQKTYDRKPRGLIHVCIDGNPMPHSCKELANLKNLLDRGLLAMTKGMSSAQKKKQSPLKQGVATSTDVMQF